MAAVHTDKSYVRVWVTGEFHSYEQFLCRSCFYPTRVWSEQHDIFITLIFTGHDAYLTYFIVDFFIIKGARLVKSLTM